MGPHQRGDLAGDLGDLLVAAGQQAAELAFDGRGARHLLQKTIARSSCDEAIYAASTELDALDRRGAKRRLAMTVFAAVGVSQRCGLPA